MATSLVSNLRHPICVAGFRTRGDQCIENVKNSSKEFELSSCKWLVQTKALRGDVWMTGLESRHHRRTSGTIGVFAAVGKDVPDGDNDSKEGPSEDSVNSELFRQRMEKMVGDDAKDASFEGKDLAKLIRNKYGRSYDVQLIKKDFFGRQLLAMNVMWKYREQRSFPLTEEEYLLHLDYIAENLRGWGAVSYVRDSLEKTKERPRIGKAVSIFINPDESGERAREWISR